MCRRPPRPRRGTACRHVVPPCRRWRYDALLVSRLYPADTAPSKVPSGFCGMYSYFILTKFSENWSIGIELAPDAPTVWSLDRQSVAWGTRVSVRVDISVSCTLKKKN